MTTRVVRATRRRAWPGSGPAAERATRRRLSIAAERRTGRAGLPTRDRCRRRAPLAFGPGAGRPRRNDGPPGTIDGRTIDPESGVLLPPERRMDRLGRPRHWDTGSPGAATRLAELARTEPARTGEPARPGQPARNDDRGAPHSSVARVEPAAPPQPRGGSIVGLSDWERWLELCARMDGFPRHLSIHSGGMLITAAPLIDIAPLERATMKDRVVVQYDKRDVETLKLIKLDLLGLGMLAAIDETLQLIEHDCAACLDLDRLPGGDPRGLRDAPGGRHRGRLPGREPGPDADAARSRGRPASTTSSWRSRSSGPARSRATPSTRTCAASRASSR